MFVSILYTYIHEFYMIIALGCQYLGYRCVSDNQCNQIGGRQLGEACVLHCPPRYLTSPGDPLPTCTPAGGALKL